MKDLADIVQMATEFVTNSPMNKVEELGILQIFEAPLVGVAQADDSLFGKLKEASVVSPEHMLPRDWLAEAETVISYFLPFSDKIIRANRLPGLPATEWLYGRIEGQNFNFALLNYLAEKIIEAGGKAVCPGLDQRFIKVIDNNYWSNTSPAVKLPNPLSAKVSDYNYWCNWSERHVAFVAGLGTFGLHNSLITKKGCAGRFGSLVLSRKFNPTPRPYEETFQYCPWFAEGECGHCIKRCPAGAINENGTDIDICLNYIENTIKPSSTPRYGCGKCQTAVPCEHVIPYRT